MHARSISSRRALTAWLIFFLASCAPASAMTLASPDIRDGAVLKLDQVYPRCGGSNVSPALSWSGVPGDAKSLVLTVIDTSVKPSGWSHWTVVDLPRETSTLARGATQLPRGATALVSDFGNARYDGPCPPKGSGVHHYEFAIWALREPHIPLRDGSAKLRLWLEAHALAHASIAGTFGG